MGSIKASDLPRFKDRRVIVQEDLTGRTADAGDDYREVEGKVVAATEDGLAIQTRTSVVMIQAKHILDVEELTRTIPRRLVRRWIRDATPESVKQHLLDRHGLPFALIQPKEMTAEMLIIMHNKIDHSKLGHNHGDKPPSNRKTKPIPGQRAGDHDDADEIQDDVAEE